MGARFGGARSRLMWESDGRGAFGACVAARRTRSVAIEGGGCIGPRRAAHKIPAALRTFFALLNVAAARRSTVIIWD